jgi:hypothetical protein
MLISSILKGGLGNYLFQVAAGYSKSIDLNVNYAINTNYIQVVHKPLEFYLDNIFRNIKLDDCISYDNIYYEPYFHYHEIPDFKLPTIIDGYFQSEKYFNKNKKQIKNLLSPSKLIKDKIYEKYPNLENENICSIHIRRGDYVGLQNVHPVQNMDYYKKAIDIIGLDVLYFIISDDISWCKSNFNFLDNCIFVEGNLDYEDLYLMSMCKNNIIANSTFSWWGSWLNEYSNKQVIAPKNWFGLSNSNFITDDLYCEGWIKL